MWKQKQKSVFQKMREALKPLSVTLALAMILFLGNSVEFLRAQESGGGGNGAAPEAAENQENVVCQQQMELFILDEEPKYNQFMESHFNNKSSTGTLLSDAFGKYQQYRTMLYDHYAQYFPQQYALQLTEGIEPGDCLRLVEDALSRARNIIEQKARTTSTVKKTTALLQKYKDINDQMATLVQSFMTMKKHLDTFADKLPCYVRRSCNKG